MKEELRVIISGGGTGGHIFPAISIANAIKAQHPDAQILFVGAEGRIPYVDLTEKIYSRIYPSFSKSSKAKRWPKRLSRTSDLWSQSVSEGMPADQP